MQNILDKEDNASDKVEAYTNAALQLIILDKLSEKMNTEFDKLNLFEKVEAIVISNIIIENSVVNELKNNIHTMFSNVFRDDEFLSNSIDQTLNNFKIGMEYFLEEDNINATYQKLMTILKRS